MIAHGCHAFDSCPTQVWHSVWTQEQTRDQIWWVEGALVCVFTNIRVELHELVAELQNESRSWALTVPTRSLKKVELGRRVCAESAPSQRTPYSLWLDSLIKCDSANMWNDIKSSKCHNSSNTLFAILKLFYTPIKPNILWTGIMSISYDLLVVTDATASMGSCKYPIMLPEAALTCDRRPWCSSEIYSRNFGSS